MTSISNVVENRDGTHFGSKLEVIASSSGVHAVTGTPWKSSLQHKESVVQYNHSFSFVVICRDRDGGRVYLDSTGRALVDYVLSPYDGASVLAGVVAGCKIMRAAGAKRIGTIQAGVPVWEVKQGASEDENIASFEAWVKQVEKAGIAPNWSGIGSAHQVRTVPMPSKHIADPFSSRRWAPTRWDRNRRTPPSTPAARSGEPKIYTSPTLLSSPRPQGSIR